MFMIEVENANSLIFSLLNNNNSRNVIILDKPSLFVVIATNVLIY